MAKSHSSGTSSSGHSDQRYVSIGILSKHTGLSPQVLRDYERREILDSVRSIGGHRRYHLQTALQQIFNLKEQPVDTTASSRPICYARVSGNSQSRGFDHEKNVGRDGEQSDLLRQVNRLKIYSQEHYGVEPVIYSDTGSGMNPDRKAFGRMIDAILAGQHTGAVLLLTYRERLIRFNFQLCERICRFGGVRIVILDNDEDEEKDLMVEVAEDVTALIGFLHARINGQKAARTNTKTLAKETIELAVRLHQEGRSWWNIVERLKRAGHRASDGSVVSYHVLKKNVGDNLDELMPVVGSDENLNSFAEWTAHGLRIKRGSHTRLSLIHAKYATWCEANNIEPLSLRRCGKVLRENLKLQSSNRWSGHTEFMGIEVVEAEGV